MLIDCLSPESKSGFYSEYSHCNHHCNYSSECLCLDNNMQTDNYNRKNLEGKLTYQINSNVISNDEHSLRKTNSLFNIREKIYNKNQIRLNENNLVLNCKNVLSNYKCGKISNKKSSCINKNIIRKNINKKNELLEKIKLLSNKIENTINLYRENKNENDTKNKINNRMKFNDLSLNFQYNNSKFLESIQNENERQTETIYPINIFKKIYNEDNPRESKKIKSNYAKLNKQKKFYIDNSINLNLNKINDKRKANKKKDSSNYYKLSNNQEETNKYKIHIGDYAYYKNEKSNNKMNRNNSCDEYINKKSNSNYDLIKKEIYKREIKNKEKNKKNYRTEENQQKNNKNNKYSKYKIGRAHV